MKKLTANTSDGPTDMVIVTISWDAGRCYRYAEVWRRTPGEMFTFAEDRPSYYRCGKCNETFFEMADLSDHLIQCQK